MKLEDVTDNYNYIAFKMEAATTQQKQAIVDNVTVEPIPSCEDPDDLTVEAITGHTATFSWTDNGGSDAWQIYVATDNTLPEELVAENLHEVTTNPGTVGGLAPQTSYYAWVRGNCGNLVVYGAWSDPVSFTTGVACPQLISLMVSEVATTSATINWTSDGQETAWQVCVNNDEAHLVDVVNNTYTIPGLTPATTYTVKVRANCGGEDGYSDWSNPKYFTTEVACPEQIDFTVSDIASTYATLNWTSYGQETAWQICLNDDEAHLIDVTNNSYTFTNLTPATEYTVKMRANCGIVDGYSDWTYEQWFTTDFCDPEYKCNISYTANGFTGWDEATIAIMDDETEIAWLTMNEGSGELALCPGQYSIVWYGYCEGDGSFSIYGSDGIGNDSRYKSCQQDVAIGLNQGIAVLAAVKFWICRVNRYTSQFIAFVRKSAILISIEFGNRGWNMYFFYFAGVECSLVYTCHIIRNHSVDTSQYQHVHFCGNDCIAVSTAVIIGIAVLNHYSFKIRKVIAV